MSSSASAIESFTVRVPWPVTNPASHSGYQMRSARSRDGRQPATLRVVQQEHVDVGSGTQLAAGVGAEGDQRDARLAADVLEQFAERPVEHVRQRFAERDAPQGGVGEQRRAGVPQRCRDHCVTVATRYESRRGKPT